MKSRAFGACAGSPPADRARPGHTVGDIGWRHHRRLDQLAATVDAEMRLPAEIPLAALRDLGCILVEEVTVASTIAPVVIFSPLASRCRCILPRKRPTYPVSGTDGSNPS